MRNPVLKFPINLFHKWRAKEGLFYKTGKTFMLYTCVITRQLESNSRDTLGGGGGGDRGYARGNFQFYGGIVPIRL